MDDNKLVALIVDVQAMTGAAVMSFARTGIFRVEFSMEILLKVLGTL